MTAFFASDPALFPYRPFLLAAAGTFVLLSIVWSRAARAASEVYEAESRFSRAIHVFMTGLSLALVIVPIHGMGRFVAASTEVMSAGLAIEVSGFVFAVWARRHLGRHWSGQITLKHGHELIRSGPYRFIRHPIYTGFLMMYLGAALVTGEWLSVAGLALVVLAYRRKIAREETMLRAGFGESYDEYRRASWALLPGLY